MKKVRLKFSQDFPYNLIILILSITQIDDSIYFNEVSKEPHTISLA